MGWNQPVEARTQIAGGAAGHRKKGNSRAVWVRVLWWLCTANRDALREMHVDPRLGNKVGHNGGGQQGSQCCCDMLFSIFQSLDLSVWYLQLAWHLLSRRENPLSNRVSGLGYSERQAIKSRAKKAGSAEGSLGTFPETQLGKRGPDLPAQQAPLQLFDS